MQLSYDPEKRRLTLENRGVDFAEADKVFAGDVLEIEDDRQDYGETRYQTIGRLNGRLVMVVWTPRGEARHIISMRKCNDREKGNMNSSWVDPDDAPEWSDDAFERAEIRKGDKVVRAATGTLTRRGRPKSENPKQLVSLRIDRQVLDRLRETGPGWQSRVNDILRKAVGA